MMCCNDVSKVIHCFIDLFVRHKSATTSKPLTVEMNNVDNLTTAQYPAGKDWFLAFMQLPLATKDTKV